LNVLIVVDESISHTFCDLLYMKALLVYLLIDLKNKGFRVWVALLLIFSCVSKSMTSKNNFLSVWLIINRMVQELDLRSKNSTSVFSKLYQILHLQIFHWIGSDIHHDYPSWAHMKTQQRWLPVYLPVSKLLLYSN
jgi:hypothetical protein